MRAEQMALPVVAALPELAAALRERRRAVLVAPPGSGKTTLVAPWLHDEGVVPRDKEIVLLQPRRVAARSVAAFMAGLYGQPVGRKVGYQVRFDEQCSAETRIRVVTEGILTARLQRDPELSGVGAVILDEFHERSLHADLALALVKEVQEALAPDLMLIVMSATLAADPVAKYLDCRVIRAEGRQYPIDLRFLDKAPDPKSRVEDTMAQAVLGLVDEGLEGDLLGFLHGVRPIEDTRQRLEAPLKSRGVDVLTLHGSQTAREQDLALVPGPRRRVVLATNLAETSLTIPGVRAVVDSGLAKVMRYDLAVGSGRLETGRISRASADQRAGRAGRLGPGRALRLWTRYEDDRLAPFEAPEIRRVDLARLMLELCAWGVDPRTFPYFEAPDGRAMDDALRRLEVLGALDGRGLTPLGKALVQVPADPRLAAFLLAAREADREQAARWAALVEAGLVSGDLTHFRGVVPEHVRAAAKQLGDRTRGARRLGGRELPLDEALLAGFADRVGARREGARFALVGGRLAEARGEGASDALHAQYVVALDLEGGRRGEGSVSQLLAWAPVAEAALARHPGYRVGHELTWDAGARRVLMWKTTSFFDLPLERRSVPNTDRERSGALLAERAREALDEVFGGGDTADEVLLARLVTFFGVYPELRAEVDGLEEGAVTRASLLRAALPAMAAGLSSLDELKKRPAVSLHDALMASLGWSLQRRLKDALPDRLEVPSGSMVKLTYRLDGPPILAAKVQELFGLAETPRVAEGRLPVVLHLLSPGQYPLQVTTDLASFWTRTWPAVRAEMRTQYPKHYWPEDPVGAVASQKTTARHYRATGKDGKPG